MLQDSEVYCAIPEGRPNYLLGIGDTLKFTIMVMESLQFFFLNLLYIFDNVIWVRCGTIEISSYPNSFNF